MLRHIVLFKFKDNYSEEQFQAAVNEMNSIQNQIPEIVALVHGKDAGVAEGKYDYGMVADFASKEGYMTYRDHPAHKAMGATVMAIVAEVEQMQLYY